MLPLIYRLTELNLIKSFQDLWILQKVSLKTLTCLRFLLKGRKTPFNYLHIMYAHFPKGALISEFFFYFGSNLKKRCQITPLSTIQWTSRDVIGLFFLDFSQSKNFSEIKLPLICQVQIQGLLFWQFVSTIILNNIWI